MKVLCRGPGQFLYLAIFLRWKPLGLMPTLKAEFDGPRVCSVRPGGSGGRTKVEIILPSVPEKLTAAEMRQWQEIERANRSKSALFSHA